MKKLSLCLSLALIVVVALANQDALASRMDLVRRNIPELTTLASGSVDTANDLVPIYDASAGEVKKVAASGVGLVAGLTSSAAELNYNDITTLGTIAASKTWTSDASIDTIMPTGGLLTVQSGGQITMNSGSTMELGGTINIATVAMTSSAAELNYNDLTTLGVVQASKSVTADASNDVTYPATFAGIHQSSSTDTYQSGSSLIVATGATFSVEGVTVNKQSLSLPGRATIRICGDGTTINNNTIYYGPSMVTVAGAGRVCDITQVGNATEATADEKAFDNTAFQVLSMDCLTADPGASGVSFTLRTAAAATTPSVTCSVANTKLGCTANIQTTTAIAAGAVIDIAAASAGNQGTTPFACAIEVAY